MEKTLPSGMKEIIFPDGAIKYLHPDGKEETTFSDGTVVRVVNGVKILEMPNGQKEIHTNSYKVWLLTSPVNTLDLLILQCLATITSKIGSNFSIKF